MATDLKWADARPMLRQLRQLARMNAVGAQLLYEGGYVGTIEGDMLILRAPAQSHDDDDGAIVYAAPVEWPLSEARG